METNQSTIASGSQMPVTPEEPKGGVGPIAGAIIVILLLVAGGLYFWGAKLSQHVENNSIPYIPSDESSMQGSELQAEGDANVGLPAQSSSDDVSSIESDFNAMNMSEIESQNQAEMNNI